MDALRLSKNATQENHLGGCSDRQCPLVVTHQESAPVVLKDVQRDLDPNDMSVHFPPRAR